MVKAEASAETVSCSFSSILGVKVEAVAVVLSIGATIAFLLILFLLKLSSESSIIYSSWLSEEVFSVIAVISFAAFTCTAFESAVAGSAEITIFFLLF